jgi:hypothetical protein
VGFDPQEAFTKADKTRNVQDGVGIQIVKLNPIGEEEPAEERMRGKENPWRRKARDSTRKPASGRGMILGPAMRTSTGSFFRMPIFLVLCNSFSRNLVWT